MTRNILERIADGRTDLVFDYLAQGHPAKSADRGGTALINWCAYYGDVSGMRFLLANGETLDSLGPNLGLDGAAFHGHWELCQFLIENGADTNRADPDTGETPLHAALCKANRPKLDELNNRSFKKLKTTRNHLYESIDKPALKPLPLCWHLSDNCSY